MRLYDDALTFIAKSGVTYTHTYGAMGGFAYFLGAHNDVATALRFLPPTARQRYEAVWSAAQYGVFGTAPVETILPMLTSAAGIVARGGCVGIGSHGSFPGIGFHYEMWLHALGGMSNLDVLRAATSCGATAIGHASDFGSLRPGMLADLQILDRNPLENIRNTISIRYVMKNGRLYDANDLTEIWPSPRRHVPTFPASRSTRAAARGGVDSTASRQ